MIHHGWPKIKNLKQNAENFKGMGFWPGVFWGTIVAVVEFVGGIAVAFGAWATLAAALFAVDMAVAIIWKLFKWHEPLKDTELEFCLMVLSAVLFTFGPGAYSVLGPLYFF